MCNITTLNERLFAGKLHSSFTWYLDKKEVHHYAIKTLLYLRTLRENMLRCMKNLLCSYTYMQQ